MSQTPNNQCQNLISRASHSTLPPILVTSSAIMHHSLRIDEILSNIFGNVPILYEAAEDFKAVQASSSVDRMCRKRPLLSLALTCRNFYEPATRVLWRHINGLDQLIRSMPQDVVRGTNFQYIFDPDAHWSTRRLSFIKNATEENWAHLDHLAAYVKELDDQMLVFTWFDEGMLQALQNRYSNRGIHIFPHLRVLNCSGCWLLRCVNFLLHPELHALKIKFSRRDCAFCLSSSIRGEQKMPILNCLKRIHLSVTTGVSAPSALISKFLLAHATANLESVHVDGIQLPSKMVKTILQCEALEEIALKVASFDLEDLVDVDMPRPNLRKFHIESGTPVEGTGIGGGLEGGFYTRLIKKLRAPDLVDFQFSGGSQLCYAFDIKGFLQTISRRSARTIRLISLHKQGFIELPDDPRPHICTFANALHALLPLSLDLTSSCPSQLEVLDLDDVFVDLSDKEMGIIGASLPHLKSLVFSSRVSQGKSRTTLTGLWLLAKHCRNLENLGLLIDATINWKAFKALTGFDGDQDDSEARVEHFTLARNVNVQGLYLGESTIDEENVATEFFGTVFPAVLNLFYARSREETDNMVKWRAIKHSLAGCSNCYANLL